LYKDFPVIYTLYRAEELILCGGPTSFRG
jgi:hypothetical protein